MPGWRNWQTRRTQNPVPSGVGVRPPLQVPTLHYQLFRLPLAQLALDIPQNYCVLIGCRLKKVHIVSMIE